MSDYDLVEVANPGSGFIVCRDRLCVRSIPPGGAYFLDTYNKRAYCTSCGKCLRYARKKAAERGESIRSATQ